jgi:hypothetical protein
MHRGDHLFFDHRRVFVWVGGCQRTANFVELRQPEVRKISLLRRLINKAKSGQRPVNDSLDKP